MMRQTGYDKSLVCDRVCLTCNQTYGAHDGNHCPDPNRRGYYMSANGFKWDNDRTYEHEQPHEYSPVLMTGRYKTIGD